MASKVALRPAGGEHGIRGVNPPGSRDGVGGGGVAPSPSLPPPLAAGGWGRHRGRAATSAARGLAGPGHVSAPPPPTATRARFPRVAYGGHGGRKAQTRVRDPGPRRGCGLTKPPRPPAAAPVPPHSPLGTGSAWPPQPPVCEERMREGVPGLGEGRGAARGAAVRRLRASRASGPTPPRDGCGGSARARAPMASLSPPSPRLPTAAEEAGSSGSGLRRCLAPSDGNRRDPAPRSPEAPCGGLAAAAGLQGEHGTVGSAWGCALDLS